MTAAGLVWQVRRGRQDTLNQEQKAPTLPQEERIRAGLGARVLAFVIL